MFCLGFNDIDSDCEPQEVFERLISHAEQYKTFNNCKHVVIMGLWPRANTYFNNRIE